MFTCMLTILQSFKEWKERKTKNEKRGTVKYEEVGNIEKNGVCGFIFISKISEKERKLTATNY